MATTTILWLRRDLRIHDHPALAAASGGADQVLAVFVLDPGVYTGRWASADRTEALLGTLRELREAYEARGGTLAIRMGEPSEVLVALAKEVGATEVHATTDASPFALDRDKRVAAALETEGVELTRHPGMFCADISKIKTQDGRPYAVFSPFWRKWETVPRRDVLGAPKTISSPVVDQGEIPTVEELGLQPVLTQPLPAGETAARTRMEEWLGDGVHRYKDLHNDLTLGTSLLSPYLHLGSLSARELEQRVMELEGPNPAAYRRQVAWRDFYGHVLLYSPTNTRTAFQPRFDALEWFDDPEGWKAWCEGTTGYPLVDAGMRELAATGFMHNRTRMVVASFLTKNLHIDYREGEAWFMKLLLDGDTSQNNGNWQWTASLGVDPAPYFKRIFNPVLQQQKFDPDGIYVRRWVPELKDVPLKRLFEPWTMSEEEQEAAGCVIDRDYPGPIVDHKLERLRAIELYRATAPATDSDPLT
ncbi:MAG: deoxyribodipyrimidine photo-lyase [Solirubrobacterales bacterium]|nr:deoxyribodipyrimidine photo-lyase [Solirubrobacterales bacterium]